MIEDDVMRGARSAREAYARLHGFNIRAMVADLPARDSVGDWPVVSRPALRCQPTRMPNQSLEAAPAAYPYRSPKHPCSGALVLVSSS